MKRYFKFYILFCWTILIFKLLLTPVEQIPSILNFPFNDKLVHMFLFGVFIYLLMEVIEAYLAINFVLLSLLGLAVTYSYATMLEYVQNFIPGRTDSVYDSLAGGLGALIAVVIIYLLDYKKIRKPKLLLHICCIGCGAYVVDLLKQEYRLTLYFYNPNIFPEKEFHLRLKETKRVARKLGLKVIIGKYHHRQWLDSVKGHEMDPEKGARCLICYRQRLAATAKLAKSLKYHYFTSTLTTSPHKLASAISRIGKELEVEYQVEFLDKNFKKQDGFKKSVALSKELGLYRQDYCGCEFSKKNIQESCLNE